MLYICNYANSSVDFYDVQIAGLRVFVVIVGVAVLFTIFEQLRLRRLIVWHRLVFNMKSIVE